MLCSLPNSKWRECVGWLSCHVVMKLYLSHQLSPFFYRWDHSGSSASCWGKHLPAALPWCAVRVNLYNIIPPPSAHMRIMQLRVGFLAGFSGNLSLHRKGIQAVLTKEDFLTWACVWSVSVKYFASEKPSGYKLAESTSQTQHIKVVLHNDLVLIHFKVILKTKTRFISIPSYTLASFHFKNYCLTWSRM